MGLQDLLSPDGVILNLKGCCKREVLAGLAARAAELTGVRADLIKTALLDRELLGSTGVGKGIAIPHGKIPDLGKVVGVLARLERPVAFDAVDGEPVDIVFLLLAPENATAAHLKALARVSRLLRDEDTRAALRAAASPEALFAIAVEPGKSNAA